jgi:hypothetical protein
MTYFKIPERIEISEKLLQLADNSDPWFDYYNFKVKPVPPDTLSDISLIKWLSLRYAFIAGILRLEPYVCYEWHTDTRRGVAINMLLNADGLSHCVFSKDRGMATCTFQELKYEPDTFYVFNTQVQHTVFNFESPRYLLSIEFAKDKYELDYDRVLNDIKQNYVPTVRG